MTVNALLVVDIQIDNVKPNSPYPFPSEDVTGLIENTNKLIKHCQQQGWPVFLIRQNFVGVVGKLISKLLLKGITVRGEPGTELDPRLKADYGTIIDKTTQDSFYKTDLATKLQEIDPSNLYICGLDGAYCVAATAQGAVKAGYKPILIKDAIITNKRERAAKLIHRLKAQGAREQVTSNLC